MSGRVVTGLVAVLMVTAAGYGQGVLIPERVIAPEPLPIPPGTAPLKVESEQIAAKLADGAATTVVEQSFHNQYNSRIEGTFLFPLSAGAAVSDFGMTVNGQMVAAELLDAGKARRVYEEIVRRQRDPGLLEYLGATAFKARIFPIEPGETKKIRLEYTQAVEVDNGLAEFRFPLRSRAFRQDVPRPRPIRPMLERHHSAPSDPGEADLWASKVGSLSVTVEIESRLGITSVYSPSHEIDLHRVNDHKVKVGWEASNLVPQEDFALFYQLSDATFGLNLLTYRSPGDAEGTFMILLSPRSELRDSEVQAKDVVFVFDTSGSMSGDKIQQAREALKYCLNNLNPGDRFNVLSFSTAVDPFRAELVVATKDGVRQASEFVEGMKARGGTNIDEALGTALKMLPRDEGRPAMVLFLTDGLPTAGETRVARILEHAGEANRAKARMFVFGVGHDVNTVLLDRLSNENHGTRTFVKPDENIEQAVSGLYQKISSPVLGDLNLEVDGVRISELQPLRLPDLFRGSQLTILGRYEGAGQAKIRLTGKAGQREEKFEYSADFPREDRQYPFLPRLWATRRIGYLLEQIRLNGEDKELVEEVVRLATRYGILTPYTSYLVLEPGVKGESLALDAIRERRAAPAPAGPGMGGGGMSADRPTTAASGQGAVERSQAEGKLRDAGRAEQTSALAVRNAGARTFYLVEQSWVESTYPKDVKDRPVVKVKYGSDAWLELAGLRADLAEVLAVGERVKADFKDFLLVIDEDGLESLTDAQRKLIRG